MDDIIWLALGIIVTVIGVVDLIYYRDKLKKRRTEDAFSDVDKGTGYVRLIWFGIFALLFFGYLIKELVDQAPLIISPLPRGLCNTGFTLGPADHAKHYLLCAGVFHLSFLLSSLIAKSILSCSFQNPL
jgi:hypothetical protein